MMSRLRLRTAGASTEGASSSASLLSSSGIASRQQQRELSSSARKVTSKHACTHVRRGAARGAFWEGGHQRTLAVWDGGGKL